MDTTTLGRSRSAIGIDIGGTKMAVALVTAEGAILAREVLPTEAELGFDRAVERLAGAIRILSGRTGGGRFEAIGIGCAGPVDSRKGLINNPFTLTGWDRCNIVEPLHERFQVPVYLENDADAAALGEWVRGAAQGFDPVVVLTFGTGIGGAAVCGGEIYRGAQGEHPELGHIIVRPGEGPNCYCGANGCLESIASGTAIAAAGKALGLDGARSVFAAAATGEPAAQAIVARATSGAALAAWTFCHTFLPQRLVLGGGMMEEHFDLFSGAMAARLDPATQFTRTAVSIARATLGNDAGVVGAASIALRRGGPVCRLGTG